MAGQYIGVTVLFTRRSPMFRDRPHSAASGTTAVSRVIPIAIWPKQGASPALFRTRDANSRDIPAATTHGRHMWGVATLTISSGGDNLGVYLPFFATHPPLTRLVIVVVFLIMTAVWCLVARWLARHRLLQPAIRRWGSRVLPIVLIMLGIRILFPK